MQTLSTINLLLFVGLVLTMSGFALLAVQQAGRVDHEPASIARRWTLLTATGLILWLAIPFALANKGILADFSSMPSPIMILLLVFTSGTIYVSVLSPLGKRLAKGLSLYTLFGFQVFRVAVEVLLALFHKEGLAPIQVTLEGRNWDLISGMLALGVLVLFRNKQLPRAAYMILNLIGLGPVLNVMTVSALSLPTPFQVFMEDNSWIARAPFVWLPTFLVQLAIAGHMLFFRKLLMERETYPTGELAGAR